MIDLTFQDIQLYRVSLPTFLRAAAERSFIKFSRRLNANITCFRIVRTENDIIDGAWIDLSPRLVGGKSDSDAKKEPSLCP
jgi:hypothetical protein